MKAAFLFVVMLPAGAGAAWAHVMSMSTGDIRIEGNRAQFELRMPVYEVAHVRNPQTALLENVRFSAAGQPARLLTKSCHEEMAQGVYICAATYEFPAPVDRLGVECTLHTITVPNHVHLLRALKDGKQDQQIFDFSYTRGEIRFDPPTALEIAVTQTWAGMARAAGGLVQILFLVALVLAARGRRELVAVGAMFLTGEIASAVITPMTNWAPAPRFVEAAMALTIAYLAVEILALPEAGKRWLIAGVLGVFHGLYFALFLKTTEYRRTYVLAGAVMAEVVLIAVLALVLSRIGRAARALRPVQVSAALLLAVGMFWFFARLRG